MKPISKGLFPSRQRLGGFDLAYPSGNDHRFFPGDSSRRGAALASFVSYAVEKRVSKHPEKFGKGVIEGVAAPEAANNAASSSAFIPLLTLGIPANVVMAMLFAGLLIHNITPGPLLLQRPSGCLLGGDHQHVYRECDASGIESSSDRDVGSDHQDSPSVSFFL